MIQCRHFFPSFIAQAAEISGDFLRICIQNILLETGSYLHTLLKVLKRSVTMTLTFNWIDVRSIVASLARDNLLTMAFHRITYFSWSRHRTGFSEFEVSSGI